MIRAFLSHGWAALLLLASATPASSPPSDAGRPFEDLLSGRQRGLGASLLRGGLWLASLGYGLGVRLRNLAYSLGWMRTSTAPVPVISIGNLTVGGTGKTPCVEYVASYFNDRHCRVCILSRGYGADESGENDESLLLAENLPDVPHLQGSDRTALASVAVEELESEILVLDDGFQHRRLARDLDLVLIDATCPWGYGHLLPRGLMREPASSLRRASAAIITRRDQVSEDTIQQIRQRIDRIAPTLAIAECVHLAESLVNGNGEIGEVELLRDARVAVFSGIGNPEAFAATVRSLGGRIVATRIYPDHHGYTSRDVENLMNWASALPEGTVIVTTQKDLVKLRLSDLGGRRLWALRVRLAFTVGEDLLAALFAPLLARMDHG